MVTGHVRYMPTFSLGYVLYREKLDGVVNKQVELFHFNMVYMPICEVFLNICRLLEVLVTQFHNFSE